MNYPYENFEDMLNAAIAKNGSGIAVYTETGKVSYKQLREDAFTLAAFLQGMGVKKGERVAMIVSNSPEFIVGYFAITLLGAIAVPINTFLKYEEFEYIINDCGAKFLFASAQLAKEIRGLESKTAIKKIIWIGDRDEFDETNISYAHALGCKIELNLTDRPKLDDLAHIIYTSGTTGKPKGAMISYRNLISNVGCAHEVFHVRTRDRFAVFLPMFHSFTLTAMVLLPIFAACSIILVRSIFPFSNVLKQVLLKRATVFLGVPAIYTAIGKAKIPWYFRWFNCVRIFISGGAPLAEQTITDFRAKFPRAVLIEGYGLSECSPIVSANTLQKQKISSVGLPLPGYEVKCINDEMMELPAGEVGELIV